MICVNPKLSVAGETLDRLRWVQLAVVGLGRLRRTHRGRREESRQEVTDMAGLRDMTREGRLRSVEDGDLGVFFGHQMDPKAIEMAAFSARDKEQFAAHWAKVRADDTAVVRTIVADGLVAGNIGSWEHNGQRLLGYWVGREHWGRGVATEALTRFVEQV